jgi:NitT/TauT family transport system permease protein
MVGVTLGVLMAAFRPVYDALSPVVELLRPIPSVAMIPLAISFVGLGDAMRLPVTVYAASG